MERVRAIERQAFRLLQDEQFEAAKETSQSGINILEALLAESSEEEKRIQAFYLQYILASAAFKLGEVDFAERILAVVLAMSPSVQRVLLDAALAPAIVACLDIRAAIHTDNGRLRFALNCYTAARDVAVRAASPRVDVAQAHANVAAAHEALGEGVHAVRAYREALQARLRTLGDDHPVVAGARVALGNALLDVGQWRDALCHLTAAHGRLARAHDTEAVTDAELSMAACARMLGKHQQARTLCEHAVALRAVALGPTHARTVDALMALGTTVAAAMPAECGLSHPDLADALACFRRAGSLRAALLGASHPDTLAAEVSAAHAHAKSGAVDVAADVLQEVRRKAGDRLGPRHPFAVAVAAKHAEVALAAGRVGEARDTLRASLRAVGIDDALPGAPATASTASESAPPPHAPRDLRATVPLQSVAAMLNNLGNVERYSGNAEAARGHYLKALSVYTEACGPTHTHVAVVRVNLGCAQAALGLWQEAQKEFAAAYAIRASAHGADNPETLRCQHNVGVMQWRRGDRASAARTLMKVAKLTGRAFGAKHPRTRHVESWVQRVRRERTPGGDAASQVRGRRKPALQDSLLSPARRFRNGGTARRPQETAHAAPAPAPSAASERRDARRLHANDLA